MITENRQKCVSRSRDLVKMADDREPPPLFDDDNNEKQDEGEDLFTSATEV